MTGQEIEELFKKFVLTFGGEVVIPPANIQGHYADYKFVDEAPPIVAELKCLLNDGIGSDGTQRELKEAYGRWQMQGLVSAPQNQNIVISSQNLPPECNEEVFRIIKMPLQRVLSKANKQIGFTKELLGVANARGLVFLINEEGYSLSPETLAGTVSWILERQEKKHINCVVIFTLNMTVTDPERGPGGRFWLPIIGPSREGVSMDFLKRLEHAWVTFLGQHLGETIRHFEDQPAEIIGRFANERNNDDDQLQFKDIEQNSATAVLPGRYYWQPQTGIGYFCDHADESVIVLTMLDVRGDELRFSRFELSAAKSSCFVEVPIGAFQERLQLAHSYLPNQ